ncbi:MAG: Spy/CpxP family protein refolding chaperone [Thiobacillus sp.]
MSMNRKRGFWIALWLALVVVTGWLAWAHGPMGTGHGPWHGWGRMGAWEMDRGDRGDGPHAWEGRGPGMMGFGMWGHGVDYARMLRLLTDLTPEQAEKIDTLQTELTRRNLGLMQQRREAQTRLSRLYASEKRDWDAIRAAARTVLDLQRQQMEAAIDTRQKIDGLLTDSQRRQMAHVWRSHEWLGRHNRQRAPAMKIGKKRHGH